LKCRISPALSKPEKMVIVYLERLNVFGNKHANARKSLATWKAATQRASWKNRFDVLKDFPRAKMIANNRARFEIVHNVYRLIGYIDYKDHVVEIRFIGTHSEYDRIDPETI
jgi:mRNA interferase HigB